MDPDGGREGQPVSVRVYGATGQLVHTAEGVREVALGHLAGGIYRAVIQRSNEVQGVTLMK
ncbi:MAG: hypothetical protein WBA12_07265 [Catalinimonas sp.]